MATDSHAHSHTIDGSLSNTPCQRDVPASWFEKDFPRQAEVNSSYVSGERPSQADVQTI
jgi:hypothetical protein